MVHCPSRLSCRRLQERARLGGTACAAPRKKAAARAAATRRTVGWRRYSTTWRRGRRVSGREAKQGDTAGGGRRRE
eukprot:1716624-Prymnesium_polylepis.1